MAKRRERTRGTASSSDIHTGRAGASGRKAERSSEPYGMAGLGMLELADVGWADRGDIGSLRERIDAARRALEHDAKPASKKRTLATRSRQLTALNDLLIDAMEKNRVAVRIFDALLASSGTAILWLDTHLQVRFFTPAVASFLHLAAGDIGRPVADIVAPGEDRSLQADASEVVLTGEPATREIGLPDTVWYLRRITALRTAEGGSDGVVVTFTDVSNQKRMYRESETARAVAEAENTAKSHFIAAASHDLRQPLQTLQLLHGLLEKAHADGTSGWLLHRMQETLDALSGIVDTVLDVERIHGRSVRPEVERFPVASVLQRLKQDFLDIAQARSLDLRVVPCNVFVNADRRMIEQILRNFLSNAVKHAVRHGVRGRILLGCRRHVDVLRIEVHDTGTGMGPETIERVVAPDHPADAERKDEAGGASWAGEAHRGLGLGIAKRLADGMAAPLGVRSTPGRGSVFSIDIPLARKPPQDGPNGWHDAFASQPPAHPGPSAHAILIVEDDAHVRETLRLGLIQAGYRVATAADGREALNHVEINAFLPDLVIADSQLPFGMGGLDVIERIGKLLDRPMAAISLSGSAAPDGAATLADNRIPHLKKPVGLDELLRRVSDLLAYPPAFAPPSAFPASGCPAQGQSLLVDIVNDEASVREQLRTELERVGVTVSIHESGEAFLASYDGDQASCVIIDTSLPGMPGLDVLRALKARRHRFPVLVMTGRNDIGTAVEAMKLGAADVIEKPFSRQAVERSLSAAFRRLPAADPGASRREAARAKLAQLTDRQRQVLDLVVKGHPNKIIAAELGLSQRTVENHRASIMSRMGAVSLSALMRIVLTAEE